MRGRSEALGHLDRAVLRPVRDGDVGDPATFGRLQRLQPDATGSDDQNVLLAKIAQRAFGEREGHRARGRRVRADRGLRASATAGRDRRAEEERQSGPDRSGRPAGAERVTDLAEDLRLAENERVEARCDATQVARDVLSRVHVEVVEQELARDAVRRRERIDELVARVVDTGGQSRVELDAVTRLQHRVLEDGRAALRAGTERADALAELDRSGAMAEPETDESVHAAETLLRSARENAEHARARDRRRRNLHGCRAPRGR